MPSHLERTFLDALAVNLSHLCWGKERMRNREYKLFLYTYSWHKKF